MALSTIKVQIAALSVYVQRSLQQDPLINRFCKVVAKQRPAPCRKVPTWDLSIMLKAVIREPFEPISEASLRLITLKTVFLIAMTTARSLSELQALSIREPYMQVLEDRVILRTDQSFVPKVASSFHKSQDIILPSFCNKPANSKEEQLHRLDVRRCLLAYLDATKEFRTSEALFVLFSGNRKGKQASKGTISRWIKMAILEGYKTLHLDPPQGLKAHSTRALATSWAEKAGATPEQICKAATWSSMSTFIRHYRLDVLSNQDQAFGGKVLQAVVPP